MAKLRKQFGKVYWGLHGRLNRILDRATNPLWVARRCLRQTLANHCHRANGQLLDIGCGSRPYRNLFTVDRYIGIDLPAPGCRADAYANALRLPFADASFDAVLCNQVLEHVPDPARLMREAQRVLRPNGTFILTTPQVWGLHHEPHDYFRFTRYGLTHLAQEAGLKVIAVTPTCGLWATFAQRVADTVVYHYAAGSPRILQQLLGLAINPILLAGYALDRLLGKRGDTLDNLIVARKPSPHGVATECPTSPKPSPVARSSSRVERDSSGPIWPVGSLPSTPA